MKKFAIPCATAILAASCTKVAEPTYSLTATLSPDDEGMMAYIISYDTGEPIDSAIVTDCHAEFHCTLDSPILARLIIDNTRRGTFILEDGPITFDASTRTAAGGNLNARLSQLDSIDSTFDKDIAALNPSDSLYESELQHVLARRDSILVRLLKENADNPVGYYIFLQEAYEMDMPTLDARLKEFPQFADSKRIKNLRESLLKKAETSVGCKYKDFTIEYGDSVSHLSDFVGKDGKYTLVDYWASWCGPCINATKIIKELYRKYGPNGTGQLVVVGVAVWDDPSKTLEAIKSHELTWPQIIDANTVPTDLYGISGIPCIMLIGPDGTILSRDLQGAELVKAVEDNLTQSPEE